MSFLPGRYSLPVILRRGFVIIISLLVVLCVYMYIPVMSSPEGKYLQRKGGVKSATITKTWKAQGSQYTELDLVSTSNLKAQITIRIPEKRNGPLPVALLLGGVGTGRDACAVLPKIENIVCVSMSYPYSGGKSIEGLNFFYNIRELQKTVKDTPPALMLALDYILSQPFSDVQQVELIGVSFGVYFISIPAVYDKRVTRVWIVHGAAEPVKAMIHYSERDSGVNYPKRLLAYFVGYGIGSQYVDPGEWVGRIFPRPVMLVNAENDRTFSQESVIKLHNMARQPKEIFWTRGEHITPGRREVVEQLSDIVVNRIESDFLKRRRDHR